MTAIVIIFAAITGAVLSVYLKQLSDKKNQNPQTALLHQIPPDSADVKTLYEVFSWGREAMAEYLYYGEIDAQALKDDGTGDLTRANYHAEVSVSFEEDAITAEVANLKNYRQHGFKSRRFSIEDELMGNDFPKLTPQDISPPSNTANYDNLISITDQDYSQFLVVGFAHNIVFRYVRVEAERVTTISVVASGQFETMEGLFQRFNTLVDEYGMLPA